MNRYPYSKLLTGLLKNIVNAGWRDKDGKSVSFGWAYRHPESVEYRLTATRHMIDSAHELVTLTYGERGKLTDYQRRVLDN